MRAGRKRIPGDQLLDHPMRRALLRHLIERGGCSTAVEACAALGIAHRMTLREHARLLARDDHVWLDYICINSKRSTSITITRRGKAALARATNPPPMLELSP